MQVSNDPKELKKIFQVLLLGSTNRKLAVFEGDSIKNIKKSQCSQEDLKELALGEGETLVISVRPDLKPILQSKEKIIFFDPEVANKNFAIRGFYREMGVDRLSNLLGAIDEFPAQSLGVLDFGTCTTLTFIKYQPEKKDYEYSKGYILPGISANLQSISAVTTSLPRLTEMELIEYSLVWKPAVAAKTPKSSIFDGILHNSLLLIQDAINFGKKESAASNVPFKIIITGGWSVTVQSCLNKLNLGTRTHIEPNLTLIGGKNYLKRL